MDTSKIGKKTNNYRILQVSPEHPTDKPPFFFIKCTLPGKLQTRLSFFSRHQEVTVEPGFKGNRLFCIHKCGKNLQEERQRGKRVRRGQVNKSSVGRGAGEMDGGRKRGREDVLHIKVFLAGQVSERYRG